RSARRRGALASPAGPAAHPRPDTVALLSPPPRHSASLLGYRPRLRAQIHLRLRLDRRHGELRADRGRLDRGLYGARLVMADTRLRSPLGRVMGLGSAKEGVAHWWAQRLTAVAL